MIDGGIESPATPDPRRPASRHLALATVTGAIIAVQSRVNAGLGEALGNSGQAAFVCFAIAFALLCVLVASSPRSKRGMRAAIAAVRSHSLHPLALFAGLGGAGYVAAQTYVVPVVGVALFTVAAVGGQLAGSLVSDRLGLGPQGTRSLTRRRVVSATAAAIAVLIIVSDRLEPGADVQTLSVAAVLAFCAGAAIAAQIPTNGRVAVASRSHLAAAWFNAAAAAVALGGLMLGEALLSGVTFDWRVQPPALYLGGLISGVNVLLVTHAVMRTGVLMFAVCQILGVVGCALVMDLVYPIAATQLTSAALVGSALLVTAAIALVTDTRS